VFPRSGEGEEALAKKLVEAQTEVAALKLERDALKRLLRDRESAEGKVLHTGVELILFYALYSRWCPSNSFSRFIDLVEIAGFDLKLPLM